MQDSKNYNNKRLQTNEMKRKCKSFFVQQNKNFLWTRYEKKKNKKEKKRRKKREKKEKKKRKKREKKKRKKKRKKDVCDRDKNLVVTKKSPTQDIWFPRDTGFHAILVSTRSRVETTRWFPRDTGFHAIHLRKEVVKWRRETRKK